MRTILTTGGAGLINRSYETREPVRLSGFILGTATLDAATLTAFDASGAAVSTVRGTAVYTATTEQISWQALGADTVMVFCHVPYATPSMTIGNVSLVATVGTHTDVLTFSAVETGTVKFVPTGSGVGMQYTWALHLNLPGLDTVFDWSALEQRVPEWGSALNEQTIAAPATDAHDQFVLQNHTRLGGVHVVLNSLNQHWGCPLTAPFDTRVGTTPFLVSGGRAGDAYRRT